MVAVVKDIFDLSPEEKKALAIYFDATGRFPFDSYDGQKYFLICVYKNYIHAELMPDRSAPSYVTAYRSAIDFFRSKGHVFSIARLDNETSSLLERFFTDEAEIPFQYISAGSHRANKAERAIRAWKNHFIAGLATVDPKFPMDRWSDLKEQAELTLNHLRPFADSHSISAYEGIFGQKFDFLAHPLAPPGIKVLVYDPNDTRKSWAPHGTPGFVLGPALQHYRSQITYIPDTKGKRFSDQCSFHPVPFMFPGASTQELLLAAIDNLQLVVTTQTDSPSALQGALAELLDATAHLRSGSIPPGPRSPDGLLPKDLPQPANPPTPSTFIPLSTTLPSTPIGRTKRVSTRAVSPPQRPSPPPPTRGPPAVPASTSAPVRVPCGSRAGPVRVPGKAPLAAPAPTSLPTASTVPMRGEAKRVTFAPAHPSLPPPAIPSPIVVPESLPPSIPQHPLRTHRAVRPEHASYRPLTPQESSKAHLLALKHRIGQHFIDTETIEEFVIDSVVMPAASKGRGSQTPHYRMFLSSEYLRPTALREYEYTRCSEILSAKYVDWVARGQSAFACAILAEEPRDQRRAPNQTYDGKPLNKRSALKLDPALWTSCREEEWHRLLENTVIPIYANTIPSSDRKNIAYYNEQVKEKVKTVNGVEHIEARVRGTYGASVTTYEGPTSANTADYALIKTLLSAVLHDVKYIDPETRFINLDMVDFYLYSPMEKPAYMRVPIKDIPVAIVDQYDLHKFAIAGLVHFKIVMSMYGHQAAGHLANRLLIKTIEPAGYYEDRLVPCLIKHKSRSTIGALVVDDLGLKVSGEDNLIHIVEAIEKVWKVKINRAGDKFVGLALDWDYSPSDPTLKISANTVVPDGLKRFYPGQQLKGADTPSIFIYHNHYREAAEPPKPNPTPLPHKTQNTQQFTGTFSHLARTVRHDAVPAINHIAMTQGAPTTETIADVDQLANYFARYPDAFLEFKATDMILRVHYDSSLKEHARHKSGFIIYHSDKDAPPESIGNIVEVSSTLETNAVASIAEGEYCAQFKAGQKAYHHGVMLEAMGYPQPAIQFFGDNTTAIGIANDSVKIKKAKAVDKAYHWFRDKVRQGEFISTHIPSHLNAADYMTKPLPAAEHNRQAARIVRFPPPNPLNPSVRRKYRK